jgi:hypothetical protein
MIWIALAVVIVVPILAFCVWIAIGVWQWDDFRGKMDE